MLSFPFLSNFSPDTSFPSQREGALVSAPDRYLRSFNVEALWGCWGNRKPHLPSCLCHLPESQWWCENSVQSLSCVRLFVTLWAAAHQASLSISNSRSLLKLMSIESVMPSNWLILCCPFSSHLQSFPASESFQMSPFFPSGGQSIGVSASASILPMNIQNWFPLGWTGWISLLSKGLSRVFYSTVQKHQYFGTQLSVESNSHIHT